MTGRQSNFMKCAVGMFAAVLVLASAASAQVSEQVIFNFTGDNGSGPQSPLIQDASGRLYGTTVQGGSTDGFGAVFALAPKTDGSWNYHLLYSFLGGQDGQDPYGRVVFDTAGNLYGTAGTVVFKLSPSGGGQWTEMAIHTFSDPTDGSDILAGLTRDAAGNLYGTAALGGTFGNGMVFELSPNSDGSWTETVLHSFGALPDGALPQAEVILDTAGNVYGTTPQGGTFNQGTVFELSPASGGWTESVLYSFTGTPGDQGRPESPLWLDPSGNLFGTTMGACCNGTVFELVRGPGGTWTEKTLHTFRAGKDGFWPIDGGLVPDKAGNLYSTTVGGGSIGYGTVFALRPNSDGSWTERPIYSFASGTDGANPLQGVVFGKGGVLYGTTQGGGSAGLGTVFKITP
jgi:uncharacterized repeat protein (TIGR03803 family)